MPTAADPTAAPPLTFDLEDFKGGFSFDALLGDLVDELLLEYREEDDCAAAPPPPHRRRAARLVEALVQGARRPPQAD